MGPARLLLVMLDFLIVMVFMPMDARQRLRLQPAVEPAEMPAARRMALLLVRLVRVKSPALLVMAIVMAMWLMVARLLCRQQPTVPRVEMLALLPMAYLLAPVEPALLRLVLLDLAIAMDCMAMVARLHSTALLIVVLVARLAVLLEAHLLAPTALVRLPARLAKATAMASFPMAVRWI